MGADDDAVAGLEAQEGLEDGGGGGVGGGDHRGDDADGLGNPGDAVVVVLLDDAAGLGVLIGVVNVLGGVLVLDNLVLHHAHARFLHGHFGQGNAGLLGGDGRRLENMIYLLLGIGGEGLLRRPYLGQGFLEGFYAVHKGIVRGHGFSLLLSCGYSLGVCVIFLPSGRPHPGLTKV